MLMKTLGGMFAPYGEETQEALAKVKAGQILAGDFAKMRNPLFHRKVFALFGLLFDVWSETCPPMQYKGIDVRPELERFRKDLVIMAGYFTPVFAIDGTMRLNAKSISFASMDQQEFEKLFSALIDTGLQKILKPGTMTEAQLRARVDQLLAFDQ